MKTISYKDFLDFLASDLNEVEYFGCDKTSVMSLKDYLLELKQKKEQYDKLISEPLKSIHSKNKWVENIRPDHDFDVNGLVVLGKKYLTFLRSIQSDFSNGYPGDYLFMGSTHIYLTNLWHQKDKKIYELLKNSQEELREINKIAHQLNVIENSFTTVSDKFEIDPSEYDKCDVKCFGRPIVRYIRDIEKLQSVNPMMDSKMFFGKEGIYPESLIEIERQRLVKKLFIKY